MAESGNQGEQDSNVNGGEDVQTGHDSRQPAPATEGSLKSGGNLQTRGNQKKKKDEVPESSEEVDRKKTGS